MNLMDLQKRKRWLLMKQKNKLMRMFGILLIPCLLSGNIQAEAGIYVYSLRGADSASAITGSAISGSATGTAIVTTGTDIAEATTEPVKTKEPENTATPGITAEPEATATPEVTTEPEETKEPDGTTQPEESTEPSVTKVQIDMQKSSYASQAKKIIYAQSGKNITLSASVLKNGKKISGKNWYKNYTFEWDLLNSAVKKTNKKAGTEDKKDTETEDEKDADEDLESIDMEDRKDADGSLEDTDAEDKKSADGSTGGGKDKKDSSIGKSYTCKINVKDGIRSYICKVTDKENGNVLESSAVKVAGYKNSVTAKTGESIGLKDILGVSQSEAKKLSSLVNGSIKKAATKKSKLSKEKTNFTKYIKLNKKAGTMKIKEFCTGAQVSVKFRGVKNPVTVSVNTKLPDIVLKLKIKNKRILTGYCVCKKPEKVSYIKFMFLRDGDKKYIKDKTLSQKFRYAFKKSKAGKYINSTPLKVYKYRAKAVYNTDFGKKETAWSYTDLSNKK